MRQIGTIPNAVWAERFTAFLITKGIATQAEEDGDAWAIWVRDEDQLDEAKTAFEQFTANPDDPQYQGALREATAILGAEAKRREQAQKNVIEMRGRWRRPGARRNPLVIAIILLCVGVFMLTGFGRDPSSLARRVLGFRDVVQDAAVIAEDTTANRLVDVRKGEVWRLITPIFLHGGIIHLAFNMFMFHMFGSAVEDRRGTAKLAMIVIFVALISNSAQGLAPANWGVFGGGPNFLGMSGVVYGLLGYLWMKTTYEPESGLHVSGGTVAFLLIWMFLGFAGVLKPMGIHMANLAHGVGFVTGLAIGYWPQFLRRLSS
jgi:GlpG protein